MAAVILSHPYTGQVRKDIDRSLFTFDISQYPTDAARQADRDALERIVNAVMCKHPTLHYVQGYHDVCSVFFLVGKEKLGFQMAEAASLAHFRETLRPSLEVVLYAVGLLYPLLRLCDAPVHALLIHAEVPPFFALSWFLTWFAHDLTRFAHVCRIFDFFLASHPLMPVYMSAAVHCPNFVPNRPKHLFFESIFIQ